jgi:hypothetical protein
MGDFLDGMMADAESCGVKGDWAHCNVALEFCRSITALLHGPGDMRVGGALARLAAVDLAIADRTDRVSALPASYLARGAVKTLAPFLAGSDTGTVAPELEFARGILVGAAKLLGNGREERLATLAGEALELSRGAGSAGRRDGDPDAEARLGAALDEIGTYGKEGQDVNARYRAFLDQIEADAEESQDLPSRLFSVLDTLKIFSMCEPDMPRGTGGPVPEADRARDVTPPGLVCLDFDSAHFFGSLDHMESDMIAEPAALKRMNMERMRGGGKDSVSELTYRSVLGGAMADQWAASRIMKDASARGEDGGPDGGPGRTDPLFLKLGKEVAGMADPSVARECLFEAAEGLEREAGPADPDTLDAKARIVRFLRGDSGPARVLPRMPEEQPPDEDLRAALELALQIRSVARLEASRGGGDQDAMRDRSVGAALSAAWCLSDLGDGEGAAALRREAALECGVDPDAEDGDMPFSLRNAAVRFDLAESVADAGRHQQASMAHNLALGPFRKLLGASRRLTIRSMARIADCRMEMLDFPNSATMRARAADSLEEAYPLDPAVPELRFLACADLAALGESEAAIPVLRSSVEELGRRAGVASPRFGRALWDMAKVLHKAGDHRGASEAFRRTVEWYDAHACRDPSRRAFMDDDIFENVLDGLAFSLHAIKNHAGAAEAAGRRHEVLSRLLGEDSPEAQAALAMQAGFACRAGDHREGLRLLERAYAVQVRVLGPAHHETRKTREAVKALESFRDVVK